MLTLFETTNPPTPQISGLLYVPDFIGSNEEKRLLKTIDALPWETYGSRRIQPYGGTYKETGETIPLPMWGQDLAERLYQKGFTPFLCNQILVNEYNPGQGIGAHVDYGQFAKTIVSISLGSHCVMDLVRTDGSQREEVWLEPRSALILSDEARYAWTHGIAKRKKDQWNGKWFPRSRRVSITLRSR